MCYFACFFIIFKMLRVKDLPLILRGSQFPPDFSSEYIRLMEW